MAIWRAGGALGSTLYRGELVVGMCGTPEAAEEIVRAMNARRPGSAPPEGPGPAKARGRTESGAKENLAAHYRKVAQDEGAAAEKLEAELRLLRREPRVVRYVEAEQELETATKRRDAALRDLGLLAVGGRPGS